MILFKKRMFTLFGAAASLLTCLYSVPFQTPLLIGLGFLCAYSMGELLQDYFYQNLTSISEFSKSFMMVSCASLCIYSASATLPIPTTILLASALAYCIYQQIDAYVSHQSTWVSTDSAEFDPDKDFGGVGYRLGDVLKLTETCLNEQDCFDTIILFSTSMEENAAALYPENCMIINYGLICTKKYTEDELKFIILHEIGHLKVDHFAHFFNYAKEFVITQVGMVLNLSLLFPVFNFFATREGQDTNQTASYSYILFAGLNMLSRGFLRGLDKLEERRADYYAASKTASFTWFAKIEEEEKKNKIMPNDPILKHIDRYFFDTHPEPKTRAEYCIAYRKRLNKEDTGEKAYQQQINYYKRKEYTHRLSHPIVTQRTGSIAGV